MNNCIIDFDYQTDPLFNPTSICMFDIWSVQHAYWHGFVYIILHYIFKIKKLKQIIILNIILIILHTIEEIVDNNTLYSLQSNIYVYHCI